MTSSNHKLKEHIQCRRGLGTRIATPGVGTSFQPKKNVRGGGGGGGGGGLNVCGGGGLNFTLCVWGGLNVRGGAKFHIVQINKKGCLQEIGKHPPIAKHNKIIDIIFLF